MNRVLRHGDDHALERVDVVRELRRIGNHAYCLACACPCRYGVGPQAGDTEGL
jgi:hypothetical protein